MFTYARRSPHASWSFSLSLRFHSSSRVETIHELQAQEAKLINREELYRVTPVTGQRSARDAETQRTQERNESQCACVLCVRAQCRPASHYYWGFETIPSLPSPTTTTLWLTELKSFVTTCPLLVLLLLPLTSLTAAPVIQVSSFFFFLINKDIRLDIYFIFYQWLLLGIAEHQLELSKEGFLPSQHHNLDQWLLKVNYIEKHNLLLVKTKVVHRGTCT